MLENEVEIIDPFEMIWYEDKRKENDASALFAAAKGNMVHDVRVRCEMEGADVNGRTIEVGWACSVSLLAHVVIRRGLVARRNVCLRMVCRAVPGPNRAARRGFGRPLGGDAAAVPTRCRPQHNGRQRHGAAALRRSAWAFGPGEVLDS